MLRLDKLILTDFGPYQGVQEVEFDDGVNIFRGVNGGGKTTLLNAFKYVFFKTVRGRRGNLIDYMGLMNDEALDAGRYEFSVVLFMDEDGDKFTLTRGAKSRIPDKRPVCSEDFKEFESLQKNSQILSSTQMKRELERIMPQDISRFFLFDGELLDEYEELLDADSRQGVSIKNSIEKILGMPVLTNGLSDIKDVVQHYTTAWNEAVKNDTNATDYVNQLNELRDLIEGLEEDKVTLMKERDQLKIEYEDIEKDLKNSAKIRALLEKKSQANKDIDSAKTRRDSALVELRGMMSTGWKSVLFPVLSTLRVTAQKRHEELERKKLASQTSQHVISEIQSVIDSHHCTICGQDASDEVVASLQIRLDNLKSHPQGLSDDEASEDIRMQEILSTMAAISIKDESAGISAKVDEVSRCSIDLVNAQERLKEVQREIDQYGSFNPDVSELTNKHAKAYRKLSAKNDAIEETKNRIEQYRAQVAKLEDAINKLSRNKDVATANARLSLAKQLQCIFEDSIEEYELRLKRQVEEMATDLFKLMSSDSGYTGLEINDTYGLNIIKADGKRVPNRSMGYEHLVALSLIGALHKSAPMQGPVVMDSPLFRLDMFNKPKVVASLPEIADQVILLVYEGEIDEQETRRMLGGDLKNEYVLNHKRPSLTVIERV